MRRKYLERVGAATEAGGGGVVVGAMRAAVHTMSRRRYLIFSCATCFVVGGDQKFVAQVSTDLLFAAAVGSRSWQCGGNRSAALAPHSLLKVAAMHTKVLDINFHGRH